jgi:ActR/RegA family two-component response regulator
MSKVVRPIHSVLVVDSDRAALAAYRLALQPRTVFTVGDVLEAVHLARSEKPDLALVDLRLERQPAVAVLGVTGVRGRAPASGLDLVGPLLTINPLSRIVLIANGRTWAYSLEARAAGAEGMLSKRLGPAAIMSIIERDEVATYDTPPALPMSLDRATYEYLTRVFIEEHRNVQRTAEILGITRNKLKRKLKEDCPER